MNILIDLRPLIHSQISGVTVYISNLCRELIRIDDKNNYYFYYNSFRDVEIDKKFFHSLKLVSSRIPNLILNICFSFFRWPKIDKLVTRKIGQKIDVCFFLDPRPAPVSSIAKKIVTFHDLSFNRYPKNFSLKTRLWHKILRPKKEAFSADTLIAVSNFTAKELIDTYQIPQEKIQVIHHGLSRHFQKIKNEERLQTIKEKYALEKPFILSVSTIEPRKNLQAIIKALNLYNTKNPDNTMDLVIVGRKNLHIFRDPHLEENQSVKRIGFIKLEDKVAIYNLAVAYLGLSFYEGFCFPVLEAMKCGCPVICSNVSALPEITANYATLVDPFDINAIANHLEAVVKRTKDDPLLVEASNYAKKFTWRRAAEKTLKVLTNNTN